MTLEQIAAVIRILKALGILGIAVAAFWAGLQWKQHQWDSAIGEQQAKAAQIVTVQRVDTGKVETVYVDHVRTIPALTAGLLSQCLRIAGPDRAGVPAGPGVADAPLRADAATRQWCDELAESWSAGKANSIRLDACTGWITANGGGK